MKIWFWSFDICKLVHSILQGTKLISLDHKKWNSWKWNWTETETVVDVMVHGSQEGIDTSVRFKIVGFFFRLIWLDFAHFLCLHFGKPARSTIWASLTALLITFSSSTVYCICCWIFANTVRISDSSHSVTGRQVQVSSIGISLPVEHYEFQF